MRASKSWSWENEILCMLQRKKLNFLAFSMNSNIALKKGKETVRAKYFVVAFLWFAVLLQGKECSQDIIDSHILSMCLS